MSSPRYVDLLGAFPLLADGGVGQAGIHRGHGVAGMVEQSADHFLGHVMVDPPSRRGVPELVSGDMDWLAEFVCDTTCLEPLARSWRWNVAVGMGSRPSGLALPRGNSTRVVGNRCRVHACCASIMVARSSSMGTTAARRILWLR